MSPLALMARGDTTLHQNPAFPRRPGSAPASHWQGPTIACRPCASGGATLNSHPSYTAFVDRRCAGSGSIEDVAGALADLPAGSPPLIFDDATGAAVELDLRNGPDAAIADFHRRTLPQTELATTRPGRGRPRLGVTAREVTLLPQHWDWLAGQPGGASAALRRLVDEARRNSTSADRLRLARDAAYRAMSALAGDLPGFEDASRALFRPDWDAFDAILSRWPADIAAYLARLSAGARTKDVD